MADNAVFARSVEALKHNEQRVLPFGVHEVLQLRHLLDVLLNFRQSAFVGLMFPMITGVEMLQPNLGSRFDAKFSRLVRHDFSSYRAASRQAVNRARSGWNKDRFLLTGSDSPVSAD